MLSTDMPRVETLVTADGLAFRSLDKNDPGVLVRFFARRVFARGPEGREMPVSVGLAAEIKNQSDDVTDEVCRLLLTLVSQDFPAEHKIPMIGQTHRGLAAQIIQLVKGRPGSPEAEQDLYDLVARALARCGHTPGSISVPGDRLLSPDETLELWTCYRLGKPIADVDELAARYQAHHNHLVAYLFGLWGVVKKGNFVDPLTSLERSVLRPIPAAQLNVGIQYSSNDIAQTSASHEPEKETSGNGKPNPGTHVRVSAAPHGAPRTRLSSSRVGYLAPELRGKTSLIRDLTYTRFAGEARAAKVTPGQNAQAFVLEEKGRLARTRKSADYDFDVETGSMLFAGRTAISIELRDHEGEKYQPARFGDPQRNQVQANDALVIPIDVQGLAADGASRGTIDAVILARQLNQYRYRRGLPIAIVIPAADKVLSEAELAAIPGCRAFPEKAVRDLLTVQQSRDLDRATGTPVQRMRNAALQNPGIARSLNSLQVMARFFERYEVLLREAVAISSTIEIFFTMTSTDDSGWSRTYGSVELIEWLAQQLARQVGPMLPALVARERTELTARLDRIRSLSARVRQLEVRRDRLRERKEMNTTALIVMPWNKPARLDSKDKQAEAALTALVAEMEGTLEIKPRGKSTLETRRKMVDLAALELAARIRTLEGSLNT